jgi:hypothetical protein
MDFRDDAKNEVDRGIYRFTNNDTLEICFSYKDAARPTDFKAEAGSDCLHMIMKRQPGVAAPEIPKKTSPKSEQLHGKWKLEAEFDSTMITLEYRENGTFLEESLRMVGNERNESKNEGNWQVLRAGPKPDSMIVKRTQVGSMPELLVQFQEPNKIVHDFIRKDGSKVSLTMVRE